MLSCLRMRLAIFFLLLETAFSMRSICTHNVEDRPEFVLCMKEMCFAICLTSYPDFVEAFPKMCKAAVSICLELPFLAAANLWRSVLYYAVTSQLKYERNVQVPLQKRKKRVLKKLLVVKFSFPCSVSCLSCSQGVYWLLEPGVVRGPRATARG